MANDRPTFCESWYRVADLRPRLRCSVQTFRQHFRGHTWHVIQDPANTQFFRLHKSAYHFVGLLDGQRTVAAAWIICNEEYGDESPTQGEVVQLLGQLYSSNLLQAELAGDTEVMFRRYRKRMAHEVRGYLTNLLCVRIPLIDPNHILDRWVVVVGSLFSVFGLVLWLLLIMAGLWALAGKGDALMSSAAFVLSRDNLVLLYVAYVCLKLLHELGHGLACKRFGRMNGMGSEVHTMGIMLLVFVPVPYIDASSAWAFRSKWQRMVISAAGMFVELAVAATAAIVWLNTAEGTTTHAICYNLMFIASVSTLLFNGNPLLRYDAYYILSDLLEIPNLDQRAKEYVYYLVKRYAWGIKHARSPVHTPGERYWFLSYAISSFTYRVVICAAILLFVAGKLFLIGILLAMASMMIWVFVPLGKLAYYLSTSGELARVRPRAVMSSCLTFMSFAAVIGLIPFPSHARADGTVEPQHFAIIHAATDGFVDEVLASGCPVAVKGPALVKTSNLELIVRRDQLLAEYRRLKVRRQVALDKEDVAVAQAAAQQLAAVGRQIAHVQEQMEKLVLRAPFAGTWVSPDIDRAVGAYVRHGDPVGAIASLDDLVIRAVAGQAIAAQVFAEASQHVELRVAGRPDIELTGTIQQILPAGCERLPSAALGYAAGGSIEVDHEDPQGTQTAEPFFEIRIKPDTDVSLLPGQRVVARFSMGSKPLGRQWWQSLCRLFQRRFHI